MDVQPTPIPRGLRRFAWVGTLLIIGLAASLFVSWRTTDFFLTEQPVPLLLGWRLLRKAVNLYGEPMFMLRVTTGLAAGALIAAFATNRFQKARPLGRVAAALIGLAGLAAAIPLFIIAAVVLTNIGLWAALITLIAVLVAALSLLWVPLLLIRWLIK